jgi:hypothetical protein
MATIAEYEQRRKAFSKEEARRITVRGWEESLKLLSKHLDFYEKGEAPPGVHLMDDEDAARALQTIERITVALDKGLEYA